MRVYRKNIEHASSFLRKFVETGNDEFTAYARYWVGDAFVDRFLQELRVNSVDEALRLAGEEEIESAACCVQ